MKKLISGLAAAFFALSSLSASAWTIHADFDQGQVGDQADGGGDGFHGAGGLSTYSDEQKLKYNSGRIAIEEGSTGYGNWGGEFRFPEKVFKGETVWFIVHMYFPEGFDHYSYGEGNRLKMMRIQTLDSSGRNSGYNDLLFDKKGSESPYKWIYEGENIWSDVGTPDDLPEKETWVSYEMSVTLDTVPVNQGGKARVRIWKDGLLLKEITDRKTLKYEDGYSDRALLFTYWNGGSPKSQHMYVDEIIITNETPESNDKNGYSYLKGLIKERPAMGK